MQALDVHQQARRGDTKRGPLALARAGVMMLKRGRDRRIDDVQRRAVESKLPRALEQPLAVEGDGGGALVGACEQIGSEGLAPVVPDLRAVQREHDGLAVAV